MKTKRQIIEKVNEKIREEHGKQIDHNNLYSRGLAYEGYAGGYLQALSDVILFMGGVIPNSRYEKYWIQVMTETK